MPKRLKVAAILIGIFFGSALAGIRGPGKYSGVVVFDRWGGCTLYSGVYVMYISEEIKEKFRPYANESIRLNATEVFQPMNPGDGLIKAFDSIEPLWHPGKNYGVWLWGVQLKNLIACKEGQKPAVMMQIINHEKNPIEIHSEELALTLLVKQKPGGFSPSDGPSVALITRQSFWMGGDEEPRWQGRGARHGTEYKWTIGKENALSRTFQLQPGEKKRIKISFDLPPGEYEFLSGYSGGVHAGISIAGNRVAFDVDENGLAKRPPMISNPEQWSVNNDLPEAVVGQQDEKKQVFLKKMLGEPKNCIKHAVSEKQRVPGDFEQLTVRINAMHYRDTLVTIGRNGNYSWKMTAANGRTPKDVTLKYFLSSEHLAELNEYLKDTGWLTASVPERSTIKDGTEYTLTLDRNGQQTTIKCHNSEGEKSYEPLFRFIRRISRQEWLYYNSVYDGDGFRDVIQEMKQEVGMLTGKSYSVYAPMLDYERMVPVFRWTLEKPWDRSTDEVVVAVGLFGYLQDESQFDRIAALANDRDSHVRYAVSDAMARFGGERAVEVLQKMLKSTADRAAWSLIQLGDIAVPTLAKEIRKGTDMYDQTSIRIIRAYIDHWDEIPKPLDKRITDAVLEAMQFRLKFPTTETQYHQELLTLANVTGPVEKSVLEVVRIFVKAAQKSDLETLDRVVSPMQSDFDKKISQLGYLLNQYEYSISELYWCQKENLAVAVVTTNDSSAGDRAELGITMNYHSGRIWLVGNLLIETPVKVRRVVDRMLKKADYEKIIIVPSGH